MAKSSTDVTLKGWMPEATKVSIPASNFTVGNSGRKAAVLHIIEGSALSAVSWFKNPASQVSAHFIVTDAGAIFQCVSVLDTAYGNGLSWNAAQRCWVDPKGHLLKAPNPTPAWQGLTPPINPNRQTVSIEREGRHLDHPTAAENAAVVRILQYLHAQFPTFLPSWVFMQTLIGHCHLSPIERANCPGPNVDYVALANAANATATPEPTPSVPYVLLSPCTPFTDRSPSAPLAGVVLQAGAIVNMGDERDGWLWISDRADTPPGIGFIPESYARPL